MAANSSCSVRSSRLFIFNSACFKADRAATFLNSICKMSRATRSSREWGCHTSANSMAASKSCTVQLWIARCKCSNARTQRGLSSSEGSSPAASHDLIANCKSSTERLAKAFSKSDCALAANNEDKTVLAACNSKLSNPAASPTSRAVRRSGISLSSTASDRQVLATVFCSSEASNCLAHSNSSYGNFVTFPWRIASLNLRMSLTWSWGGSWISLCKVARQTALFSSKA
mmetsp:Transcript_100547/g.252070  ORF Transcript_100547/g.252070 Transcript_100547/m.252070 type:complete len:229 (+) Transcript_100547:83-769(+)